MTKNLDDFVNEGWHFIWGVSNNMPICKRNPHSDVQSIGNYNTSGSMLRAGAAFRIPIRAANLGGARKYDFEGDSVFLYLRDSTDENPMLISEGEALEPDKGLIRKVSVFKEIYEPDKWKLVSPEMKVLDFVVKKAKYDVQRGKQYFSPAYVDANGSIITEGSNAQRLHGFHLEFPDFRWDARRGTTTQYMIVLGENAQRELQALIQENPFTLFDVYTRAFPHFVQAKGDARKGRYLEHPKLSKIFYVENTPDFKKIQ